MSHPDEKDETGDKQGCSVSEELAWYPEKRKQGCTPTAQSEASGTSSPLAEVSWLQRADALPKGSHASSVTSVSEKPVHATIGEKKKKS